MSIRFEFWIRVFDIVECGPSSPSHAHVCVSEWALVGITEGKIIDPIEGWFEWITEYTIIGYIEGWFEFTSLGISERASGVFKEKRLFVTNDTINEGDKIWTTVVSTDLISDEKMLCNDFGKTEVFLLTHKTIQDLDPLTEARLLSLIIPNLGKNLVPRNTQH